MLEIVQYPHPALRYKARPIEKIDDALRAQVREMFGLMYEARGIGLAATQVALPFRFFILNLTCDPEQRDEERVLINPQILKRHSSLHEEEGCLSLPGLYAPVHRAKKVRVRAFDLDGNLVEFEAEDMLSRAIQHETDHLDGKLFIDYLGAQPPKNVAEELAKFVAAHKQAQAEGVLADDATLLRRMEALARGEAAV